MSKNKTDTIVLDGEKIRFKKGALHRQLKIPESEDIGMSNLNKISKAEIGTMVTIKGKKFKVTPLLKKRAVFGKNIAGRGKKKTMKKSTKGSKSKTHSGEDYTGHTGNVSKSKGKDIKKENMNRDY